MLKLTWEDKHGHAVSSHALDRELHDATRRIKNIWRCGPCARLRDDDVDEQRVLCRVLHAIDASSPEADCHQRRRRARNGNT